MEYQKVVVRGEFLHDQELHLGPRALIQDGDSKTTGGLFSQKESSIGYLVITPFKLEGREYVLDVLPIYERKNNTEYLFQR